jgi:hypothetical protein
MKISRISKEDVDTLMELYFSNYFNSFNLPDPTNLVGVRVAKQEEKIIGFGLVKTFHEAVLILDPEASIKNKVLAVRNLLEECKRESRMRKIDSIHAFVKDNLKYEEFLIKHFGFQRINGTALVLDIEEGNGTEQRIQANK